MSEDLGVAQLRVVADTSAARASLDQLRQIVARGFPDLGNALFAGLDRQAATTGSAVGTALSRAITQALASIDLAPLQRQLQQIRIQPVVAPQIERPQVAAGSSASGPSRSNASFDAKAFDEQAASAQRLERIIARLNKSQIALDTRALLKLSEDAQIAGQSVLELGEGIVGVSRSGANTVSGLRAQASAFRAYADSIRLTTKEAKELATALQAAQISEQRLQVSGLKDVQAARELFASTRPRQGRDSKTGQFTGDQFLTTERLLNLPNDKTFKQNFGDFTGTAAGLKLYVSLLKEALDVTSLADPNFNRLTAAIRQQEAALRAASIAAESFSNKQRLQQITPDVLKTVSLNPNGPALLPDSNALQQRAASSGQVIDRLKTKQQEVSGTLQQQLQLQDQLTRKEEQRIRLAEKLRQQQQYYSDLNPRAGGVRDASGALLARGSGDTAAEQAFRRNTSTFGNNQAFAELLQSKVAQLDSRARAVAEFNASPITGRLKDGQLIPGSPASLAARNKLFSRIGGNALIGGAFPLLFGQGLGASVGGGLGGAIGGAAGGTFGFGASLVGTALGQALDTLSTRFKDLAAATQDPIKNIDTLTQQFQLASKAQEDYVKSLIDSGQTARAAQVVNEQLSRTIDPTVAASVASANDTYNRKLAETQNLLGAIVSGPASGFVGFLNGILRGINGGGNTTGTQLTSRAAQDSASNDLFNARRDRNLSALGTLTGFATDPTAPFRLLIDQARVSSARRRQNIADSGPVATAEANLTASQKEQLRVQDAINQAREQGNIPLANALTSTNKLNNAKVAFDQRDRQIAVSLAAGDIKAAEAAQQRLENQQTLRNTQVEIVGASREGQRLASQQLSDDRRRAEVAAKIAAFTGSSSFTNRSALVQANADAQKLEQRLQLEQAGRAQTAAQQAFNIASQNPANKAAIEAAKSDLLKANAEYETARVNTTVRVNQIEVSKQAELRQLERQRDIERIEAALRLKSLQEQQVIESQRRNFGASGNGVLSSLQNLRETSRAAQAAAQRANNDPGNEALQTAAVDASERLRLASIQTRNNLLDAYEAAKRSAEAIGRSLADAKNALLINIGGPSKPGTVNGLLQSQFGTAGVLARQQDAFPQIVSDFRKAQEALAKQETNLGRPQIASLVKQLSFPGLGQESFAQYTDTRTGRTSTVSNRSDGFYSAEVNQQIVEATRALQQELGARNDISSIQNELVKANNDVAVATAALSANGIPAVTAAVSLLTTQVSELAKKDWNVYVNAAQAPSKQAPPISPSTPTLSPASRR